MFEDNKKLMELLESIQFPDLPYRSIIKDYDNAQNCNPEICKECGGECCKRCGCSFSPDDFEEISFEYLKEQIQKGYISIDYVDGEEIYDDVGVYILRMRNQGAPIVDTRYLPRTPCVLWREDGGCIFSYKQRPSGGKLLVPAEKVKGRYGEYRRCHSTYTREQCCYEWKPHQRILYNLSIFFRDKDFECSIKKG